MNTIIINEFERLISFLSKKIDEVQNTENKDIKAKTIAGINFKIKIFKNVLTILKKYPNKLTKKNYLEIGENPGIGKGTLDRIKEIIETNSLSELDDFIDTSKQNKKTIDDLESVIGIGHTKALEFLKKGITSVKDLKQKIKNGNIEVNDKIILGLKYYGKFKDKIPRNEIDEVNKIFKDIIKKMNITLKDDEKYIYEICGSYRREKLTSGDIDILISKHGNLNKNFNYLKNIVEILKEPQSKNDNKPLLIDDMTDKNIYTKYMGFSKYKNNPPRRIDIRFIPYDSYFSALVYFTGSANLNKTMRNIAKSKKLKLSEYGLFKQNGEKLLINSEKDLFAILEMDYLPPKSRDQL
jgi:DNA polymerase/3'-5' exonuclease PolX